MGAIAAAAIPAIIGGGASIIASGKKNNPTSATPTYPTYQPQYQGQADDTLMSLVNDLSKNWQTNQSALPAMQGAASSIGNVQQAWDPLAWQYRQTGQAGIDNPYKDMLLAGAQTTATTGANGVAPLLLGGMTNLRDVGASGMPYVDQILQTGFDPQQALYGREYQKAMDHSNAVNAMNGLTGSPYGAGLTTQALNNFDMDWQDRQLGRQVSATQGWNSLGSGIGRAYGQADQLGQDMLKTMNDSYSLPYNSYQGVLDNNRKGLDTIAAGLQGQSGAAGDVINANNSTISGMNAAANPQSQAINALLAYLGAGQSASTGGNSSALSFQGQNFNQGQTQAQNAGALGFGVQDALKGINFAKLFGTGGYENTGYDPTGIMTGSTPGGYGSGPNRDGSMSYY